jgi:hypothetical protein
MATKSQLIILIYNSVAVKSIRKYTVTDLENLGTPDAFERFIC